MTKLVTVYDLDGQPHEMTTANANDMVAHVGWRRTSSPIERTAASIINGRMQNPGVYVLYDFEGNRHEMTPANARDMMRVGWTETPPGKPEESNVTVVWAPPAPAAKSVPAAVENEAEVPAPQPALPASETDEAPDFEAMSKEEVEAYAKEKLDLEVDKRWGKPRIVAAIIDALKADADFNEG